MRGPRGAPQPKAQDRERQPPLPISARSSRRGSLPVFRRTERSSDVRPHHDTIARLPAPLVSPEDGTDNKSEPQIPESGQSVVGLPGLGKSWIACALGHKACRDGRSVLYQRAPRMFEALALARGDGRHERILKTIARMEVLILDDWGLAVLTAPERRDLLEILEDRHGRASTIVTSQLPVEHWHEAIGDPTLADAILDRLVNNAHRLKLTGESMRKAAARNSSLDAVAQA